MNKKNKLVEIKVFRFDPTVDKEPRYEVYKVPYEGYSLLNALQYIFENYDKSLAFRAGCLGKGSSRCGVCQVLVNGVPALSCAKMVEEGMVIEPHPKFELIKDIVVNLRQVKKEHRYKEQGAFEVTVNVEKCVGCSDCFFICPVCVYEMRRVNSKLKSRPVDVGSCCGSTCEMCVDTCFVSAITVSPASVGYRTTDGHYR